MSATQTTSALPPTASPADRLDSGARFASLLRGRIPRVERESAECVAVFPALGPNVGRFEMIRGRGFASCRSGREWSAPEPLVLTAEGAGIQKPTDAVDLILLLPSRGALEHHLALGTNLQGIRSYSHGDGLVAPADLGNIRLELDSDVARPLYGADEIDAVLGGACPVPPVAREFVNAIAITFQKY